MKPRRARGPSKLGKDRHVLSRTPGVAVLGFRFIFTSEFHSQAKARGLKIVTRTVESLFLPVPGFNQLLVLATTAPLPGPSLSRHLQVQSREFHANLLEWPRCYRTQQVSVSLSRTLQLQ